ncbi:hypothetical protein AYK24_02765 [Thermoplasmatales archaeon SG8-52-4]|nr:MAG: hypothetical protein AYK24_02765 [Thermoplasmatales archaeon SG8-52-4]
MAREDRNINLMQLKEMVSSIKVEEPHVGNFKVGDKNSKILLEPGGVLRVLTDIVLKNVLEIDIGKIFLNLLCYQTRVLCPIKYSLHNDLHRIQLRGEFPAGDKKGLYEGYLTLRDGCQHALELANALLQDHVSTPRYKYRSVRKARSETESTKKLIESELKGSYEFLEQNGKWIISMNTKDYFQKISIFINETTRLISIRTTLVKVSWSDQLSTFAITLFLLNSVARLDFIRAILSKNNDSEKLYLVGLESVIPLRYLEFFKIKNAIESIIVGFSFTRLPCEALLDPTVAKEYLKRIWGLTREETY